MKMLTKLFLSLCVVIGLGAVMMTEAQIESDITIRANIPHPFVVRDTTLPAGEYTIKVADEYSDPNVLEIQSVKGNMSVMFDTDAVEMNRTPGKSELVFDKIGDRYFLSQVFLKGDNSGNQLPKSRLQQRLEDGGGKAETHSIAASRQQSKHSKQVAKNPS